MTHYLRRRGHDVSFCTVDHLMRDLGMTGGRHPGWTFGGRQPVVLRWQRQ
jgi:hypothetical protein